MTKSLPVTALCLLLPLGVWVGVVGCAHRPAVANEGPTARDYLPLDVGTRWTYSASRLGEKRTLEISMVRAHEGGFVEDSTGAQLSVDSYGVRDRKRYLLRNPLETGAKWTNVVSVSSVEHYEILSVGQSCDAPAGTYSNCVVVQSTNRMEEGKQLINEMTFAPGVGIVRQSVVLDHRGNRVPQASLALMSFKPATKTAPASIPPRR